LVETIAGAYFQATRDLRRTGSADGVVGLLLMFTVPEKVRGWMSQEAQLRACVQIENETDDAKALELFLHGDGSGPGLADFVDAGHYGWQTATKGHSDDLRNAPTLMPSPGTVAKPAFDLGAIYADAHLAQLTDPARICLYTILHSQVLPIDAEIDRPTVAAAVMLFGRGHQWVSRHPGPAPMAARISLDRVGDLEKMAAKMQRRLG